MSNLIDPRTAPESSTALCTNSNIIAKSNEVFEKQKNPNNSTSQPITLITSINTRNINNDR
jgi:hypothetical protein